eukprot:842922-Pelagomonas_calceolata.AAC.7
MVQGLEHLSGMSNANCYKKLAHATVLGEENRGCLIKFGQVCGGTEEAIMHSGKVAHTLCI